MKQLYKMLIFHTAKHKTHPISYPNFPLTPKTTKIPQKLQNNFDFGIIVFYISSSLFYWQLVHSIKIIEPCYLEPYLDQAQKSHCSFASLIPSIMKAIIKHECINNQTVNRQT